MQKINEYIKFWAFGIMAGSLIVYLTRLLLHSSLFIMECSFIIITVIAIVALFKLAVKRIE